MPTTSPRHSGPDPRPDVYEISGASTSLTADQSERMRRYMFQMGIRTVCFVLGVFTEGWLRWTFFIAAMVLPYIAVVLANNTRQVRTSTTPSPVDAPALTHQATPQPPRNEEDDVVSGIVVEHRELEAGSRDDEQPPRGHP
ncbi:DUF3099 domain-containing protein [Citricoccus sp. NR2]|uniref:DUF3099 domain-containing protein n=1 Tax=Citricoccus sp. NR2 TaxID=3004095 RepID=UPI0022DD9398|nr:DUF3099 domain-containing protein [Citricoccus sp. NR2]WBL18308.1 DUF3099 domain-containing protein [Citricoccus sp. NR2]